MAANARRQSRWQLIFLSPSVAMLSIGCLNFELPEIEETTGQTYAEYQSEYEESSVDPVGASEISICTAFEGDGYDEWWRFKVSETDFSKMATAVAKTQNGPSQVSFSKKASPPEYWRPDAKIPKWWTPSDHESLISVSWCFSAGDAQRHHGWFLLFDPRSDDAFVWHWNHQWSSEECR